MEIYSNPFDWGCHWVCNKLDCGKDVIPSKKRDSCIWEETSFTPGVIPRGQGRLARAVGNVVETQLLTPEYLGEKLLQKNQKKNLKAMSKAG